jgi:Ca2+-transporting ATPase
MSQIKTQTPKKYQITNPEILETQDIFNVLQTDSDGLSMSRANERLIEVGYNEIIEQKQINPFWLFLKQFKSFIILILGLAALISIFSDHVNDAYIILLVIISNSLIGFFQEYRAQRSIQALKSMLQPTARVLRDQQSTIIPSREVVPGDILELEEGDKIPADARLVFCRNFQTVESSLTGESLPVSKSSGKLDHPQSSLGDMSNIVFMGTMVATGHAKAVVIATGEQTEFGSIANLLEDIDQKPSHFKQKTDILAKQLGFTAIAASIIIFAIGYFIRGVDLLEMILATTAILVSAIPEGLPAILAVALSVGARKMAKNKAIIRDLPSVETLGVLDVICTDKTGTLTQNTMTTKSIFLPTGEYIEVSGEGWDSKGQFKSDQGTIDPKLNLVLEKLLLTSILGNKARIEITKSENNHSYAIIGDPTEAGLVVLAQKAGYQRDDLLKKWEFKDDLTFSSSQKYRATLVTNKEDQTENYILVTGAPEVILERSGFVYSKDQKSVKISDEINQNTTQCLEKYTSLGYRTIGLALKKVDNSKTEIDSKTDIQDLVFLGIVGIQDPVRPEAKKSIKQAIEAGIRVIILTGDHKKTAAAIATEIGLLKSGEDIFQKVLDEKEFLVMNQSQRLEALDKIVVLARLNPETKLLITEMLQNSGHLVAMTGDGVNDAPALKKADIGISMGKIGTDVARESSKMVLVDDNFSSIVLAIEEGRNIFQNVRKVSYYLLSTSLAEIAIFLLSFSFGVGALFTATQILWLNLVTDGVNGIALALNPAESDLMREKPRSLTDNILNKEVIPFLALVVLSMLPIVFIAYYSFINLGEIYASSAAFFVLSMSQIFNLYNVKSLKHSIFKSKVFDNKFLILSTLVSGALIVCGPFTFLSSILNLVGFDFWQTIYLVALSSVVLWTGEIYKFLKFRNLNT